MSVLSVLVGNQIITQVTWTFNDGGGPATTCTCRIFDPAGTATSLTVTNPSTNVFKATHNVPDAAIAGTWVIRWEITAGGTGAAEDIVKVTPSKTASP